MIYVVSVSMAVLLVLLSISIYKSFRSHRPMGNMLGYYAISCAVVVISFAVNLMASSEQVMIFFCCIQNIGVTWSYYFLFRFSSEFAERKPGCIMYRIICVAVLMIDSAVILTTPVNGIAFHISIRDDAGTTVAVLNPKLFFLIHCLLCMILIVSVIWVLADRIRHSAKVYALKYSFVIAATILMALPGALFVFDESSIIDYSVFFFGFSGTFLYYAAFVLPAIIVFGGSQGYLADIMPGTYALYDNTGVLINHDDRAFSILGEEFPPDEQKMRDLIHLNDSDSGSIMHGGKEYSIIAKKIVDRNGYHVITAYVFVDVTEKSIQIEKEHQTAIIDKLTGINNRTGFVEEAEEFMAAHGGENCYAMMISGVNGFKDINRLYGTKVGDDVLKKVAGSLSDIKKRLPIVFGRVAESKFSIMAPFNELESVASTISSLTVETDSGALEIGMRHGYVVMNKRLSLEEYYELATVAFVNSKKNEGFNVVEYSATLAEEQKRRETLIADVRNAMANKEFVIDLQPHISISDNSVVGAKAWACWEHHMYGRLDNTEFMSLLDEAGFTWELNRYVWREAAATLERFKGSDFFNGYISVELDKDNILRDDLTEVLESLLKEYDLKADKLHLVIRKCGDEITRERVVTILRELRSLGFYIEEADFGKGRSNIESFLALPFDGVIIDMNVLKIADTCSRPVDTANALVKAIQSVSMDAIVVGVDTVEDLEYIKKLGIKTAEGKLFCEAIPLKEFVGYVRKKNKTVPSSE